MTTEINNILSKCLTKINNNSKTVFQCRETLVINPYYSNNLHDDGSIYIQIPKIDSLVDISNIKVDGADYEVILDKNIIRNPKSILIKNYNMIFIRIYDFNNLLKIKISFDATFVNLKKIKSRL
jgi:hypothetical protein